MQIDVTNSVLFLDEIQAAPMLLSKLYWFAEECSELPVITAGSLLEFVKVLGLTQTAKLCHPVLSCSANGVPLGAEVNHRVFKMIFLDVGLVFVLLGLKLQEIQAYQDISFINQGGVSEQMVG